LRRPMRLASAGKVAWWVTYETVRRGINHFWPAQHPAKPS
jgi:hypothetical protein